jgi:hypothetical protein
VGFYLETPTITTADTKMRETLNDEAQRLWVLSTNKPYQILAITWIILGFLFTIIGIQYFLLIPTFLVLPYLAFTSSLFIIGFGIFFIIVAIFLLYDSQSIHNDPFPEDSPSKMHSDQPAYDWCAICGILSCPQELVRIQQKFWGISPGMFGFDGVACQDCAQRRVKRYFMISIILLLPAFSLFIFLGVSLIIAGPIYLAAVLGFIFGIVVFGLVYLTAWLWRKEWQIVTTPLAQQPELMIPVNTRLARRETVEV